MSAAFSLPPDPDSANGPLLVAWSDTLASTGLILFKKPGSLPAVWAGPMPAAGLDPADAAALLAAVRPCALLPEHGLGWFGRPGLSGHRLDAGNRPVAGRDWSPVFLPTGIESDGRRAEVCAEDVTAGLRLVTEAEAVPGGAIRVRHTLTNTGPQPYVVDSLEVVFPLPARAREVLDFTGRQTAERIPQRHQLGDGLWLREGRCCCPVRSAWPRGRRTRRPGSFLPRAGPGLTAWPPSSTVTCARCPRTRARRGR